MSILKTLPASNYRRIAEAATRKTANEVLTDVRDARGEDKEDPAVHNLAVESAFREKLFELVATLDIETEEYQPIWTLLDAVNALSDNELCIPHLAISLLEDLLECQTIKGSMKVFEYLETRRERLTKLNWSNKKFHVLRVCNELLRRLSRAEDIALCGQVFIWLFQVFPLGDKSSINLRGEFHTENVTAYDEQTETGEDAMVIDQEGDAASVASLRRLYPVFWSLQSMFSLPTRLFDGNSMNSFKCGITQTLECFSNVAGHTNSVDDFPDPEKRGHKRKRDEMDTRGTELSASTFNPKYLTNRDLFALEIQDVDFRRHVLVQALILIDFLLSLSRDNKQKMEKAKRPSKYQHTLSDEDKTWFTDIRKQIEKYLEEGNGAEGRYYLRMVNMVLSRDENWTQWKAEGCPPISKSAVPSEVETEAQNTLKRVTDRANFRLNTNAGDLGYLSNNVPIEELKKKRAEIPSLEEYHNKIQLEDLDLEMAMTDSEIREIEERKAGYRWRALRSAKGKRFQLCEDLKNGDGALVGKVKSENEAEPQEQSVELDGAKTEDTTEGVGDEPFVVTAEGQA